MQNSVSEHLRLHVHLLMTCVGHTKSARDTSSFLAIYNFPFNYFIQVSDGEQMSDAIDFIIRSHFRVKTIRDLKYTGPKFYPNSGN